MAGLQNDKTDLLKVNLENARLYTKDIYRVEAHGARFDLAIGLDQLGSDIKLFCTYNTDLFCKKTVLNVLEQITCLFIEVIKNPDKKLFDYSLMSLNQYHKIVHDFNQTALCFQSAPTIHGLFEQQVQKTPDAPAIEYDGVQITYAKLNCQANQLAEYFHKIGFSTAERVAVILEPSPLMITTLLAILKSGAHYVPINPSTQTKRIEDILALTSAKFLVITSQFQVDFAFGGKIVELDKVWDEIETSSILNNNLNVNANALAYIIHTSGTTNKPKAIPIVHSGLVNLLNSTQAKYALSESDTLLFSTSYAFDASILEIFWPLAFGAKVFIPKEEAKDPVSIGKLLTKGAITVFQTVPLMLSSLCHLLKNKEFPRPERLRLIVCGSALMTRQLRDQCLDTFQTRLVNHYGPTEVTVDAASFDCSQNFEGEGVPIGRPIANVKILIVDEQLQVMPFGVPGEILVASPGLTPGYLNSPSNQHPAFCDLVLNQGDPSIRFYKTGDRGKMDEQGLIYFLGRKDKQVKVNGNRVELEEIEQVLMRHPLVEKVLVKYSKRNAEDAEGRLLVYIEPKCINRFQSRTNYYQLTLGQRPELLHKMKAAHLETWPNYFSGSPFIAKYWARVWTEFPDYQFCLLNETEEVAAVCNGIPLFWDGLPEHVPSGWDEGIELAFVQAAEGIVPNTILGLTGVVTSAFRNQGLSSKIVQAFRALSKMHGLSQFLGPVRPIGMFEHGHTDFTSWVHQKDTEGEPLDHWLRTHKRQGAHIIGAAPLSQRIEGSLDEWEGWTGIRWRESGTYHLPNALQAIEVDVERNRACYYDPSIWVGHYDLTTKAKGSDQYLNIQQLKEYLRQELPAYMVPNLYHFMNKMPINDSGKIHEAALSENLQSIRKTFVAPKNPIQTFLKKLWEVVLEEVSFGIEEDFFLLGGQSLQVLQVLEKIEREYGIKLSIKNFYQHSSIEGLGKILLERMNSTCLV